MISHCCNLLFLVSVNYGEALMLVFNVGATVLISFYLQRSFSPAITSLFGEQR
jgi:hypothetical protein